jgi:tetratricopeptide (TPR) repeat protein
MNRSLRPLVAAVALLASASVVVLAQGFTPSPPPEARAALDRAERAIAAGDTAAAGHEAEAVLAISPDVARAYDLIRFARFSPPGSLKPFAERYRALAEATPGRAAYWYAYGRFADDPAEQERAFARVVALAPNEPWGYLGQASVDKHAGRMEKAVTLYQKALSLSPDNTAAIAGLADAYFQMPGREADALKHLERLVAVSPNSYDTQSALFRHAQVALVKEQFEPAERLLALAPNGVFARNLVPRYVDALAAKDPDAAVARARAFLKAGHSPYRSSLFLLLANAVRGKGREAADRLAAEVASWNERDPLVWMNLASLYVGEPDYAERVEALSLKAIEVAEAASPRDEEMVKYTRFSYERFKVGLLAKTDSVAAARRARELMATAEPILHPMLYRYVVADAMKRGPAAVEALVREELSSKEVSPAILEGLTHAVALVEIDADLTIQLFTRILDGAGPGAPRESDRSKSIRQRLTIDARRQLGLALMRKGDAKQAIATLETVEAKEDVDGRVALALSRAYAATGDYGRAYDAAAAAVARNPEPKSRETLVEAAKAAGRTATEADAAVLALREASAYAAHDFDLASLGGGNVSLTSLRGKVVLLNFWFPGCGPCRAEFPHLQKLYETYKARGLEVVAVDVTSDDPGATRFMKDKGISFVSLKGATDEVARKYGVNATPHTFVIGRDGRVYFAQIGFDETTGDEILRSILEPLLARPAK